MKYFFLGVLMLSSVAYPLFLGGTTAYAQSMCTLNGQEIPCEELQENMAPFLGMGAAALAGFGIITIASIAFWIMMLIHAASHPIENKNIWILVMVLLGVVGSIAYYVMVKREFDKRSSIVLPPIPPTPVTHPPISQNQSPIQPPQAVQPSHDPLSNAL